VDCTATSPYTGKHASRLVALPALLWSQWMGNCADDRAPCFEVHRAELDCANILFGRSINESNSWNRAAFFPVCPT
jgi:hypothetical protein